MINAVRRKVKCDTGAPCDRCVQSGLRCTRDIIRKRRGPKKGSGSVIAKLKNENEHGRSGLPLGGLSPSNALSPLDLHLPMAQRPTSASNGMASPFSEGFAPTSDPSSTLPGPTTLPQRTPDGLPPFHRFHPLHYPSPGSNDGYVTVSDLAHQIFDGDGHLLAPSLNTMSISSSSGMVPVPIRSESTDAMTPSGPLESPAASSTTSTPSYDGPKYLYRAQSEPVNIGSRITALASEVGLSAYLISQCVRQYFKHLYPIQPILHEPTFYKQLNQSEDLPPEEKCLILAMCAVTVLHSASKSDLNLDGKKNLTRQFLSHALAFRTKLDWIEKATLTAIIASFFVSLGVLRAQAASVASFLSP